jgi:putative tricarboxylic transport membrane protein
VRVKLLTVPYRLLFPAIMAFSAIGIYSVNNSSFEIYLTALFGVLGFVWTKLGFPAPPLLLGFVLGPMMEEHLRRAMLMAKGDPTVFVMRPISLAFIIVTLAIVVVMVEAAARRDYRMRINPIRTITRMDDYLDGPSTQALPRVREMPSSNQVRTEA